MSTNLSSLLNVVNRKRKEKTKDIELLLWLGSIEDWTASRWPYGLLPGPHANEVIPIPNGHMGF
jgi:hypothetical protein